MMTHRVRMNTEEIFQAIINDCVEKIDWLEDKEKGEMDKHDWERLAFNGKEYRKEVNGIAYTIYMCLIGIESINADDKKDIYIRAEYFRRKEMSK